MSRRRGPSRNKYSTPRKGTKTRALLLLMLRPQGATTKEILEKVQMRQQAVLPTIISLRDFGGWDIRIFSVPNPDTSPTLTGRKRMATTLAYRVVGRLRFHGGYRSFIG